MKKRVGILCGLLFVAFIAMSHEFWLQPNKYRFKLGEEMKVNFMVGESFTGEFWDLKRHKTEKLEVHNLSGKKDLLTEVKNTTGNNLTYKFSKEGTHLVVMQSDDAYIELEAEKFNDYLKEDGLDNILEERTRLNELNKPSKEYYTRFAKLLVQSGNKPDDTFNKKTGFPLEIVPDSNPYSLASGDYLQCTVLFQGKPSAHALVKVWSHVGNRIFQQNIYTEDDGTIKFPISNKGPWMVSSVQMINSEKDESAYHSLWASLVFGIE